MKSLLKELIELYKERKEYKRDFRRVQRSSLDYAALQNIVNTCQNKQVVIDIVTEDGVKITIRPESPNNQIGYESFQEKFNKRRS